MRNVGIFVCMGHAQYQKRSTTNFMDLLGFFADKNTKRRILFDFIFLASDILVIKLHTFEESLIICFSTCSRNLSSIKYCTSVFLTYPQSLWCLLAQNKCNKCNIIGQGNKIMSFPVI